MKVVVELQILKSGRARDVHDMIFCCNKMKDIHIPNFLLNNVLLTRVTKYKYLGHCISDDLSDDDDMARQYRQSYAQGNALLIVRNRRAIYRPFG